MQKKENVRLYYLDVLRVIACLSVIVIHCCAKYVTHDIGTPNFWIGNFFDSLCRVSVPLFVMISGALMLDSKYNFSRTKIVGHIKKMILFFICWSMFYCIVFNIIPAILNGDSLKLGKIINSLILGHYHLWFAYLIIGLYLITPLLRLWVKDENKKYVEYFILLSLIFSFIIPQIIKICCSYSNSFNVIQTFYDEKFCLKYVSGYTCYFILGWYINNYCINKKRVYILGFLGFITTFILTYIIKNGVVIIYDYLTINVLLQSIFVFTFFKDYFYNNKESNKIINLISKNSLGIYAIHAIFITMAYKFLNKIQIDFAIINIMVSFMISFVFSFIASYILGKIKILKKYII